MWFACGDSFYTFHGLSYVIDIYYNRIKAEYNFVDYSFFVSYFPLLVAGSYWRATHLLPQVKVKERLTTRKPSRCISIYLGIGEKSSYSRYLCDLCQRNFDNYSSMNSWSLLLGGVYFAFQIYGDSRILDMARYKLFRMVYFEILIIRILREYCRVWRRWHISYLLGFRLFIYSAWRCGKGSKWNKCNVFIIFVVSGFGLIGLIWLGFINALYFLPLLLLNKTVPIWKYRLQWISLLQKILHIFYTFGLFDWIFF
jgi:D-alanyl-lipoteichoic acid acyltransferase DltB (MBOAT superfamily)